MKEKAKQMKHKTKRRALTDEEILNDIKRKPTVPVWPHYGWALGICRGKAYEKAREGGDEFWRDGNERMIRVITAPLRKKLGIEAA